MPTPATKTVTLTLALLCGAGEVLALDYQNASYQGRKFGIRLNYDVQIRWQRSDAAEDQWMQLPSNESLPRGQAPWIHVALGHRVLGSLVRTDTLLDASNALVVQRIVRRSRADGTRFKATQYGDGGIRILRATAPVGAEEVDWAQAKPSYQPFPSWFEEGGQLSDPSAIFYLLSKDDLASPGDRLRVPIFSSDQLVALEMSVAELATVKANYVERSGETERRVKGRRPALAVVIDAQHLDPASTEEDMEVLGMRGDLEILLDAEHRVPLRITGRAPGVGKVALVLRTIGL